MQLNTYYEDLSQFDEVKQEDSLKMEQCAAYEGAQVMQQCPAYDVVSECIKKDETGLHKTSKNGNFDKNKAQDYNVIIMTGGPIYQCIDAKVQVNFRV